METKGKFVGVNSIKFNKRFQTDDDCLMYLASIKWKSDEFVCKRCGNKKYCKGIKPYSRRCIKCCYDESPTAGTMFDKCKFSLLLAFHIVFKIASKKKGMSSLELSKEFEMRQKTCWEFKWKVQQAMQSSKRYLLSGKVDIDEFLVGGVEDQKRGRSQGKKRLVVVALERLEDGVGRAAQVIENASAKQLKPFFDTYIDRGAKIITDEWNGYKPLKKQYRLLEQIPSAKGRNFKNIHIHIMNIKGWIRGIHHHCSKERLQGYLDEYHFRYNRRNNMDTIFNLLIERMVKNEPKRIKSSILK